MGVLQIVILVSDAQSGSLPTPRAELGIAVVGLFLLLIGRIIPTPTKYFAWLIVLATLIAKQKSVFGGASAALNSSTSNNVNQSLEQLALDQQQQRKNAAGGNAPSANTGRNFSK